jgi:hypothetical protein
LEPKLTTAKGSDKCGQKKYFSMRCSKANCRWKGTLSIFDSAEYLFSIFLKIKILVFKKNGGRKNYNIRI